MPDFSQIAWLYRIGYEVEAGVIRHHEEAVQAWREGKLPTAVPPASPVYYPSEESPK